MPLYEHVFLARQDISTQQVETLMKEYQGVIEELGGKVPKSEYWGLKPLAYKIKKSRKAHYALFNIDSPPAAVAEMERRMGISTDIIRFMTVKVDELEVEPSAMMRKSDRDDRGDRDGGFGGGPRGGGGFRGGGDRPDRGPPRGDRGGPGGDRPGGPGASTFRPRPPRDAGAPSAGPRDAGAAGAGPRDGAPGAAVADAGAPRAPRAPRPPRETTGSEE